MTMYTKEMIYRGPKPKTTILPCKEGEEAHFATLELREDMKFDLDKLDQEKKKRIQEKNDAEKVVQD